MPGPVANYAYLMNLQKPVLALELTLRPGPFLRRRMPDLPKGVQKELNTVPLPDPAIDGKKGFQWVNYEINFAKLSRVLKMLGVDTMTIYQESDFEKTNRNQDFKAGVNTGTKGSLDFFLQEKNQQPNLVARYLYKKGIDAEDLGLWPEAGSKTELKHQFTKVKRKKLNAKVEVKVKGKRLDNRIDYNKHESGSSEDEEDGKDPFGANVARSILRPDKDYSYLLPKDIRLQLKLVGLPKNPGPFLQRKKRKIDQAAVQIQAQIRGKMIRAQLRGDNAEMDKLAAKLSKAKSVYKRNEYGLQICLDLE